MRLHGERLNPSQKIGDVLLLGEHGFKAFEPRFQVGDLLLELVQLIGGRRAFRDINAERRQLLAAAFHLDIQRRHIELVKHRHAGHGDDRKQHERGIPR